MRKTLFALFIIVLASGLGWRLYVAATSQKGNMPRGKAPVAVELAKTTYGAIDDMAEFTGTLAGKAEVMVSPKISGIVKSLPLDLGDRCRAGQLLIILDDEEARHSVEEARAKLAVARASLEENQTNLATAERELKRIQTLREQKVAAASELDTAEANVLTLISRRKFAEASIEQQEAALRAAETRLTYTQITAPIAGYIGKRFVDEGTLVSPSTPILQLADIASVKTVIGVVEKDYAKITPGLKAFLSVDAYPGQTFEGQVARIAPILDPNTRTAETEIEIPNPDLLLKPGMFTRVRIHFGTHTNVVLVASRAIVKRDGKQGVFVPDASYKTAHFKETSLVLSNGDVTEVDGLEADTEVIIMGQHLLSDGDPILLNAPQAAKE